jgi:acyl carrier protein
MTRPIITIAAEIFQVEPGSLSAASAPDEVEKWDSLAHLRLITAVEAEYGIRLSMQQIQEIATLGDLEVIIRPEAEAS